MNYQYWLGTEESLMSLIDMEKLASANFVAMIDRRKALMETYDDSESGAPAIGDYLIERPGNGVAVIRVSGSLTNSHKWYHEYLDGEVTSYEAVGDALGTLEAEEGIDNIVLSIHSGGGAVTGIDALGEKIRRVDMRKPVRAHTQTAAFSAAYWIASSTREIIATRMAEVGSIGTLMVHQSIARMAENVGIDFTVFRAGKYKALGLPYEQLSDEVKKHLQDDIDKSNNFFLEHVSRRRNLMISEKQRWAEGRTFFAGEAQDAGLIDRVASLEEVVSAAGASHQRSRNMFISEHKRAQIAAGARPEDVLSAEELVQYKAELENVSADEGTQSGEGEGEGEGEELTEDLSAGENVGEQDTSSVSMTEELRQALRDNGKLEARAEASEAKAAALDEKLSTQRSQMESLQEIGKLAVNNLQVALGMPKESGTTPEALVSTYNDLQRTMTERFSVGRQSKGDSLDDDTPANIPLAFRTRK